MKTTLMFRPIANPRRTTLAHLKDAEEPRTPVAPEVEPEIADALVPQRTANPRRTVLVKSAE